MKRLATLLLSILLATLEARVARAAAPPSLMLEARSSCPSASDVLRELAPLLPRTRIETTGAPRDAARAAIDDAGETMHVRVGSEARTFRDPGRSCSERARTAAVFIGLVLDPPILPEVVAPQPQPQPSTPAPIEPRSPRARVTLQLGPLLQAAPISDARETPLAGGFGARVAIGSDWGLAIGAAFLLPTRLRMPAADARLVWIPFDVALRAEHTFEDVALAAELGPEAALLFVSGERVTNPRTSTRLEVGARLAGSLTWSMSARVGAFFTLFGVYRPLPYELSVNPGLDSGTTPPVWLGGALGLSLRAR